MGHKPRLCSPRGHPALILHRAVGYKREKKPQAGIWKQTKGIFTVTYFKNKSLEGYPQVVHKRGKNCQETSESKCLISWVIKETQIKKRRQFFFLSKAKMKKDRDSPSVSMSVGHSFSGMMDGSERQPVFGSQMGVRKLVNLSLRLR